MEHGQESPALVHRLGLLLGILRFGLPGVGQPFDFVKTRMQAMGFNSSAQVKYSIEC